jgi:translation elongation factor EF-1beta
MMKERKINMPYIFPPSKEITAASKRAAIREALMELLIKEKKTEIIIQCGLRALDQLMYMPEHMRTMDEAFLEIAGCVIQVKRDFELEPWEIRYNGDVIFN